MPDFLTSPWLWLILGIVLITLEALAPGIFLIWFGLAAILTALIDWVFGLSWQSNVIVFAVLSALCAVCGWKLTQRRGEEVGELPNLNRRGEALVGRAVRLDQAIVAGEGRIRVDDVVWRVSGPDLPAGALVRVTAVAGTVLIVAQAAEAV